MYFRAHGIVDEIPVVGSIAGVVIPLACEQLLILSHLAEFSHMNPIALSNWSTIRESRSRALNGLQPLSPVLSVGVICSGGTFPSSGTKVWAVPAHNVPAFVFLMGSPCSEVSLVVQCNLSVNNSFSEIAGVSSVCASSTLISLPSWSAGWKTRTPALDGLWPMPPALSIGIVCSSISPLLTQKQTESCKHAKQHS